MQKIEETVILKKKLARIYYFTWLKSLSFLFLLYIYFINFRFQTNKWFNVHNSLQV